MGPKLNVRQRRKKIEDKFCQQRTVKEVTRENTKLKKHARNFQQENSESMTLKDFMEEFRGRFDRQEKKLDKNHRKMGSMSLKLERLKEQANRTDKENKE